MIACGEGVTGATPPWCRSVHRSLTPADDYWGAGAERPTGTQFYPGSPGYLARARGFFPSKRGAPWSYSCF